MKLISAIINPLFLTDVRKALEDAGVRTFTLRESLSVDARYGRAEIYRGASWVVDQVTQFEITLVLPDGEVSAVVAALERHAGGGQIVICPVEGVVDRASSTGPQRVGVTRLSA